MVVVIGKGVFFAGREYYQNSPKNNNTIDANHLGGIMGGVTELFVVMILIAAFAFAPLGYFIYKFTKNGRPFGETEPHGDSPSLVNDLAENAIKFIQGLAGKK